MPELDPGVPPEVRDELGWYAHRRQDLTQAEEEGEGGATKAVFLLLEISLHSFQYKDGVSFREILGMSLIRGWWFSLSMHQADDG
jgi:hypothetical protein